MPENVKPQTAKDLRATCKAYDTLAEIYKEGDRARLEAEARAGVKVWQGVSYHQSYSKHSSSKDHLLFHRAVTRD